MKNESEPIELQGGPVEELSKCFDAGPLSLDGKRGKAKHFVGFAKGVKIEIFSNEHGVPHFRAKHGGETNSFRISDGEPLYPDGELKTFFRNIKKWHKANKPFLEQKWNETRPTDCTVGKIKPDEESDTKTNGQKN